VPHRWYNGSQVNMKRVTVFAVCLTMLMLAGCSDTGQAPVKKETAKAAEPVGGQSALYKMYQVARANWAADALVLTLNSIHLPEVPQSPTTAGAWQAIFTSAQLSRSRTYTFSVVESAGNLHQGVYGGPEESWSGQRGVNTAFTIGAVHTDTDAAYRMAVAMADGYDKKHPDMTISWLLEKTPKYANPAWRVIWGESVGTSAFSVLVDASTGDFLARMH
jgi:hypothetical protein